MSPYSAPTLYEWCTHPKPALNHPRLGGAVRGGSIVTYLPTAGGPATSSTTRTHSVITIHGRTGPHMHTIHTICDNVRSESGSDDARSGWAHSRHSICHLCTAHMPQILPCVNIFASCTAHSTMVATCDPIQCTHTVRTAHTPETRT